MFDKLKPQPLAVFALFAALVPAAAAQQTYLSCTIVSSKKTPDLHFDFTLNEADTSASYYWNNRNQMIRAVFTAEKVTWDEPFYLGTVIRRSIDRVTLEYTDELIDRGKTSANSKGTCKVMTPSPERKF